MWDVYKTGAARPDPLTDRPHEAGEGRGPSPSSSRPWSAPNGWPRPATPMTPMIRVFASLSMRPGTGPKAGVTAEADAREVEDRKRMESHLDAHIDRRADQRLAEAERRTTRAEKQAAEARREARGAQTALRQLQALWSALWGRLKALLGHEQTEDLRREVQDEVQRSSRSGLSR